MQEKNRLIIQLDYARELLLLENYQDALENIKNVHQSLIDQLLAESKPKQNSK